MVEAVEKLIGSSYMLGLIHAEEENPERKINAADEEIPAVAFEEAMSFLKSKVPMSKAEWSALEPKLRFRAFTVAKLGEVEVVDKAKQLLLKSLEKGTGYRETWEDLKHRVDTDSLGIKPGYWENVFRTNTQSAYIAGKLQQYQNTGVAAYQLMVIEDSRTSKICRHLLSSSGYGMILPVDHPFWKKYGFPPYHFQCRSSIRAVYPSQIGKYGNIAENPSMKSLTKFKPMEGFGGNPLSSGSFWNLTPSMIQQAAKYRIVDDIVHLAQSIGLSNYDISRAGLYEYRRLEGTKYKAKMIVGSEPMQKEILTAQILENNKHKVVFLPDTKIKDISNPDVLLDDDIVAELKVPDGSSFRAIRGAVQEADEQNVTHMVYYPRFHNYTKKMTIDEIKNRLSKCKKLKEVWLIWDDKSETVVKK